VFRETSLRAETSVEARRLLVELKRLAELNPAPEVAAGEALLGELKMFGRAQTQSHFALKSGFVDESLGQVAGFREERLAGRSGAHWFMDVDSLGVHTLRNVHGRKLGENPPVAVPDQVAVADEAAGTGTAAQGTHHVVVEDDETFSSDVTVTARPRGLTFSGR